MFDEPRSEAELLEIHYPDINCDRPLARCDVCRELWFRGTCSMPGRTYGTAPQLFCMHEDADSLFWRHVRKSERHQALLAVQWEHQRRILAALPATLAEAKAHQKLMRDPALAPLRRLFR